MNNRFLCKAKRTDNDEWIIGNIIDGCFDGLRKHKYGIAESNCYPFGVKEETICKCIYAAYDKNNNPIFEKDILLHKDIKLQLVWDFGQLCYYFVDIKGFYYSDKINCNDGIELHECKIIGNIFD